MTSSFAEIRQRARRPEATVPVCLAGDLVAEHEELDRQLQAQRADGDGGIEGDSRAWLAEQIRALEERMREDTYPFRLRALRRPEFKALLAACPPRRTESGEVDERDAGRGFDIDALYERLVPASIIDPEPGPDLDAVLAELTDGQFVELGNAAFFLNRGSVDVPFSRAASVILRGTGGE
ncbi:MAG TPA: hypothetical protein VFX60_19350 [Micromonospora sp.]|nr:hypothetical protein [Micromonospora sp.]